MLILIMHNKKQNLSIGREGHTDDLSLNWSGDIDNDNKTDYLIELNDDGVGTICLYLSSYAKNGEIAHQVACHIVQSC